MSVASFSAARAAMRCASWAVLFRRRTPFDGRQPSKPPHSDRGRLRGQCCRAVQRGHRQSQLAVVPDAGDGVDSERAAGPTDALLGGPKTEMKVAVARLRRRVCIEPDGRCRRRAVTSAESFHPNRQPRPTPPGSASARSRAAPWLSGTPAAPARLRSVPASTSTTTAKPASRSIRCAISFSAGRNPLSSAGGYRSKLSLRARAIASCISSSGSPRSTACLPGRLLCRAMIELHGGGGHHLDGVVVQLGRDLGPLPLRRLVERVLQRIPVGLALLELPHRRPQLQCRAVHHEDDQRQDGNPADRVEHDQRRRLGEDHRQRSATSARARPTTSPPRVRT